MSRKLLFTVRTADKWAGAAKIMLNSNAKKMSNLKFIAISIRTLTDFSSTLVASEILIYVAPAPHFFTQSQT